MIIAAMAAAAVTKATKTATTTAIITILIISIAIWPKTTNVSPTNLPIEELCIFAFVVFVVVFVVQFFH